MKENLIKCYFAERFGLANPSYHLSKEEQT
jgi:hypothetical protein